MKDGPLHIFAPAIVKSVTAPGRAPPWPTLPKGLPTGHYGAHTGNRTTSAPKRNSARPVEESGGLERGVNRWRYIVIWTLTVKKKKRQRRGDEKERESEKERTTWRKRKREPQTEAVLSTPGCLGGHATCTLHLGFFPHWDFPTALKSWTGEHITTGARLHTHTQSHIQRNQELFWIKVSKDK